MQKFTDRDGREWQIDLTIGNVLHVKRHSGDQFDLFDPTKDLNGQPLQVVLMSDLPMFWELLWLLVDCQATKAGVTVQQFGMAMAADCLVEAQQKFFDEWRDFFHSLRRPDAALSVEAQAKTLATAVRLVTARVSQIDRTKLESQIETAVAQAANAAFGKVQASLDAIPDLSPGESSS